MTFLRYPEYSIVADGYESREDEVENGHKFVLWPFDRDTGTLRQAEKRCKSDFLKSSAIAIFCGILAAVIVDDPVLGMSFNKRRQVNVFEHSECLSQCFYLYLVSSPRIDNTFFQNRSCKLIAVLSRQRSSYF